MSEKQSISVNPKAQECHEISVGYHISKGQHTQTMAMEEIVYIQSVTGREPALLGFELLSYSSNINYLDTDDECMTEITENYGTLKRAWKWAARKGLITFPSRTDIRLPLLHHAASVESASLRRS